MPATNSVVQEPWRIAGNLGAQVHETHTGVVVLLGDKAYKAKKPVKTDFLDFSTLDRREKACKHEVALNSRLAPDSYLGVAHFVDPQRGLAEPVIVMRRYADSTRLASLVQHGQPVREHLTAIAERLARFHAGAARAGAIDVCGSAGAVCVRWQKNLVELQHYADTVIPRGAVQEIERLATQFIRGRTVLFTERIADRRIIDGHADLLADDIFCLPEGPVLLDCLEFDDDLRYVDGIDDAAFLAMDLEFLGRRDLGEHFLDEYSRTAGDPSPHSLKDFYIAYRAVVRAKVDCVRFGQGHPDAAADACRHIDIALEHLKAGAVRLVIVGGGPGTGKTTLSHALAEKLGAEVISTDEVRRGLQEAGAISGEAGDLNAGLYAPENVSAVYDDVLHRTPVVLARGTSVILDGTWRDARLRERAREVADQSACSITEFTCSVPLEQAAGRIEGRLETASDATPQIAAALSTTDADTAGSYRIDTGRPLAESVAEALRVLGPSAP